MQPRTFCFITVFVGYTVFVYSALGTPVAVTEAATSEEQKILLDCQHSDYRTYIKCLRRQKRHHLVSGDFDHNCLESCVKKCQTEYVTDSCEKKCGHCLKKTKHKLQIITEYENECISGNCNETSKNSDHSGNNNFTTNIEIHNVIGNGSGTCCPTCRPPVPCNYEPQCPPHICPPYWNPPRPYPQIIAQRPVGLVFLLTFGCQYTHQWPCTDEYIRNPIGPIDCSGCLYPQTQIGCDVTCYNVGIHKQYGGGGISGTLG
ncbi:uncharacterized protein LOC122574190 [Bombus pyrosoma]|uniref:uncharacterized protein LOC122574190 n=1 Tax=Bombus pyrosoma TaxID=396416 RepID=UPI001CB8D74B|nr:uncharacterized protein LOC122574190 [Bombus pyrosoma]XP_043597409.1 uncharacterized protein LOC122574190 [Bombus pyrosoma]XP_043597419.1 uncharacterized protein LOC122574190 [Bombus pyrosoma]XP_043597428.1 uncharacterized protein LOC122574190 [Bombus pyrosoma]